MTQNQPFITRRSLLKTGALGIGAPFILPYGLHAGTNDRIGVGMIGMGRQALHANLKPFLQSPDCMVLAVCDADSWRLKNAKEEVEDYYRGFKETRQYKGCDAYEDFRELLARSDIDAVMISTPDHWHIPMAIAAARKGKDICCEKPLTLSIAEGRLLSDTVTQHKRVFRTDSEFRSHKAFHRAAELVRNGRIGKLHTMKTGVPASDIGCPPQPEMPVPPELDYERWLGPAPDAPYTLKRVHPRQGYGRPGWMRCRDYCEGLITNWGTHLNDIAQWGNNTERTGPVEIEGTGHYPEEKGLWNVLLQFEVHYRYANGVKLIYKAGQPYVRFEGTEGWVQVEYNGLKLTASSETILNAKIGPGEIHFPLKSEKQDFIDAVKTRGQTLEDAEVGHRTTSLCQLGHIAIQTGKKLLWNPGKERFTNSEEANRLLTRELKKPWSWESL